MKQVDYSDPAGTGHLPHSLAHSLTGQPPTIDLIELDPTRPDQMRSTVLNW